MKLFVVVSSTGVPVMGTEYESCIPFEHIDSMAAAGYKFKVNGKLTAKSNVRDAVRAALDAGVGHRAESSTDEIASNNPATTVTTSTGSKSRSVRCIETGKVYHNQSAAAKDLGIDPAQVSDSIKTGRPRSGYTFERVLDEVS